MAERSPRTGPTDRPGPARDPLSDPLDPDDLVTLDFPDLSALWGDPVHASPHDGLAVSTAPEHEPAVRPSTSAPLTTAPVPVPTSPRVSATAEELPPPPPKPPVSGPSDALAPDDTPPSPATAVVDVGGTDDHEPLRIRPADRSDASTTSIVDVATPTIEVVELHKRFGDEVAVESVSFSASRGSVLALLGPNGAGKTTTVNMLSTLLKPDGGRATVCGHDVAREPAAVRRSIMLTGQFAALDESLSGRANLVLFGRLLGLSRAAARVRADELLESFDLTDAAGRIVREYSGGMRRRVDIACGLVTRPEVVFLDEPTTGLDPRSRQEVWSLVEGLRSQGVTILLTTQYLEEADALSDQIVVIDHGRVIAHGTADELKSSIGASHYAVTPADPADLPVLRATLGDLIDDEPHGADSDDDAVLVPVINGEDVLVTVVSRATSAGIRLSDVGLRRPSLDQVFLELTAPTTESK